MDSQLSIIIPAFKSTFLKRTLQSIAAQTDRRFTVYIGDDASPHDLSSIIKSMGDSLPIVYHRFSENLGGKSLVKHWDRCIRLSKEPWIWMFSDDDLMDAECVGAIYKEIEKTQAAYDLYRFNTIQIDAEDRFISVSHPHPTPESALEYAYFRLTGMRHTTAQELIFSRSAYERLRCFPELPYAWHSDDAGIILMAGEKGVCTIPGPRVRFRRSGENLSTVSSPAVRKGKLLATMAYFEFLEAQFEHGKIPALMLDMTALRQVGRRWFVSQVRSLDSRLTLAECRQLANFASRNFGGSYSSHFVGFLKWNVKHLAHRSAGFLAGKNRNVAATNTAATPSVQETGAGRLPQSGNV